MRKECDKKGCPNQSSLTTFNGTSLCLTCLDRMLKLQTLVIKNWVSEAKNAQRSIEKMGEYPLEDVSEWCGSLSQMEGVSSEELELFIDWLEYGYSEKEEK